MKILFVTHLYLPTRCCGSEIYLHTMIKALQNLGYECRVLLMREANYPVTEDYIFDGVSVFVFGRSTDEHFMRADIIVAQLFYTKWASNLARIRKKPFFHIVHSEDKIDFIDTIDVKIIYNSEFVKEKVNYNKSSIVFHPIMRKFPLSLKSISNKFITLINLNKNKGADLFYEIAKKMPGNQFLAVRGTYSEQIISELPNVTTIDSTPDIAAVYNQTRIILIPSEKEAFGLVAAEAMSLGIPVICTPTGGLKENCGDAAIYLERNPIQNWIEEIRKLENKKHYLSRSEICINWHLQKSKKAEEEILTLQQFLHNG